MRYAIWLVAALAVTGCNGGKSLGEGEAITSPAIQHELLERWNVVVDEHPDKSVDFHWPEFDAFPHPTYVGEGEGAAYWTFGQLLLAYLENNFDYLAEHHVFNATIDYKFPSGESGGPWTLHELVEDFTPPDAFGTDEETQSGLVQMEERIEEAD